MDNDLLSMEDPDCYAVWLSFINVTHGGFSGPYFHLEMYSVAGGTT